MIDLEAIKARVDEATKGPWTAFETGILSGPVWVVGNTERPFSNPADGEFIAHARRDVPALVAELERARAVLKAVQWSGGQDTCPTCEAPLSFSSAPSVHRPDCELKALLGEDP